MSTLKIARARAEARRVLAYRAWYVDATSAAIPPVSILTDPRLHEREHRRQLRRAQVGAFDTVAPARGWAAAAA
jgi:hypothetical protein